jgi:transcription elongation GreA/GreB family factor
MSRAFVKEPDEGVPEGELPERPISEHPNYVTARGLQELQDRIGELETRRLQLRDREDDDLAEEQLALVDRDLRYFVARLESAILVKTAAQPRDEVAFGAAVEVVEEGGVRRTFTIVGEDEADLASGRISHASPLAAARLGARVGDTVVWKRPAGDARLTVAGIAYPED